MPPERVRVARVGEHRQAGLLEDRVLRRERARALVLRRSAPGSAPSASTSGWSNGLTPITAPATAVANSHRKNCAPRSRRSGTSMRTTACPARSSASTAASCAGSGVAREPQIGEQPVLAVDRRARRAAPRSTGIRPAPVLAGRLREQLLEPGAEVGDARARRRASPCRGRRARPRRAPRRAPGPGLSRGRDAGPACSAAPLRALEHLDDVHARRRRRAPSRSSTAPSSARRSTAAVQHGAEAVRLAPRARAPSPGP